MAGTNLFAFFIHETPETRKTSNAHCHIRSNNGKADMQNESICIFRYYSPLPSAVSLAISPFFWLLTGILYLWYCQPFSEHTVSLRSIGLQFKRLPISNSILKAFLHWIKLKSSRYYDEWLCSLLSLWNLNMRSSQALVCLWNFFIHSTFCSLLFVHKISHRWFHFVLLFSVLWRAISIWNLLECDGEREEGKDEEFDR